MKFLDRYRGIVRTMLLLLLILNDIACKKGILDMVPVTDISDANAFDTPERILAQVNGLYNGIKSSQFLAGRYMIYQELRSDEFIMNKPNVQTGQLTWGHTVNSSTSEVQNLWSNAYAAINRINVFMAGLEENQEKIDNSLYVNYAGEAKFLRALSYFALVQQYAQPYTMNNGGGPGLPLRLNAEETGDNNDLARSSVAEVYAQILADLNEAEENLPSVQASSYLNATRSHKNAAIALKIRVYLTMGDYAAVMQESSKLVPDEAPYTALAGVRHQLESDITQVFAGDYTGNEAILFLPMNTQDAPGGQNALSYYFTFTPGNAEYYLNAAGSLSDPVFASTSTDNRKNLIATQAGLVWLYKFKEASPYTDYIPVLRYAEVLLNRAEAAARLGGDSNLTIARSLLEEIRRRSDTAYQFANEQVATQDALIETIMQERKIELLGEGFRTPDLLRTLQPLPAKSGPAGTSPQVGVQESRYIWPIPANELSTNNLMEPNP